MGWVAYRQRNKLPTSLANGLPPIGPPLSGLSHSGGSLLRLALHPVLLRFRALIGPWNSEEALRNGA